MEMKGKWIKMRKAAAALLATGMCMAGAGGTAVYANVDEAAVAEAEAQAAAEPVLTETPAEQTAAETQAAAEPVIDRSSAADGGTAFSVPGNGEVVDDISDDPTKEFYTIRTANNNTFYMVIDKSSTSENVYMLSMIDEDDLSEFLGETETETQTVTIPTVVIEENTQTTTEAALPETEKDGTVKNMDGYVMVGVAAVIGLMVYVFWKKRWKKEEGDTPSENLEMDSGLEMINEDEQDEDD